MIEFVLNNKHIKTNLGSGQLILDFIRDNQRLKGTKIGCREGDCGACTILIGSLSNGKIHYINATSCLTPLANVHGKHIVTIEGLNMKHLSPVQQFLVDSSGTQCGFCSVGFVLSLTHFCLSNKKPTYEDAITTISGNICRCTGYKSIELAAKNLVKTLKNKDTLAPIKWLVDNQYLPPYFENVDKILADIPALEVNEDAIIVGGGTDLYVQQHEQLLHKNIRAITQEEQLSYVSINDNICEIGAGITVSKLFANPTFIAIIPNIDAIIKLISSALIRNISTVAGNFINASPIGDFTSLFIALDTKIKISGKNIREIDLKNFYLDYKKIDLKKGEYISSFSFKIPKNNSFLNFEKISKRLHLDIASVNTAAQIVVENGIILEAHISAGGIGPVPTFLNNTCSFLIHKKLTVETIIAASKIMQAEIAPITDVRGSIAYKRILLRQLFFAHFIKLFPKTIQFEKLIA